MALKLLSPDDVISMDKELSLCTGASTFKVEQLLSSLENYAGAHNEKAEWFRAGVECQVLTNNAPGWLSGRVNFGVRLNTGDELIIRTQPVEPVFTLPPGLPFYSTFYPLTENDVISMDISLVPLLGTPTFKVKELLLALQNQITVKKPERSQWFEQGVDAQVRQSILTGWESGQLQIVVTFFAFRPTVNEEEDVSDDYY